ncbi:MAG: Gfo/Idh/MocA family oxidoreductase [Treponema sp.]|uniref:Gfo/Idh/MocA family protein n=1 Tax=Treponema sp. TaxID=166 RepID=UPI00298D9C75|nr:Gfo/Idh/MocA family oxidoreductase [Treponema sp.]MBR5932562.1 Gfo/Idh/MocA family oxidoreductase [Treponema sp.]
MSKQQYTACVIGTGRIGFTLGLDKKREQPASHTMALLKNPHIRIIAGCDKNFEQLKKWKDYVDGDLSQFSFKEEKKVKIFTTVENLFVNCSPDIVVIAVNEDSHLETALYVISKKPKLVILEKPVALNTKEADRIVKQSEKFKVPVLVNHERRFALDYELAFDYIKEIGDVQKITGYLFSGMRLYDPRHEKTGGYSLLHDGTHLVDIVLYLLSACGEEKLLKPVITGICRDAKDKKVVRGFTANYSTKKVPDISLVMSGRSRFFGFEVEIIGTEGKISIGNGHAEFYKRAESKLYTGFYSLEKDSSVKVPEKTKYFANMIQNAVDFLDKKYPLKSTLKTGLDALKVLEDIKAKIK